MLFPVAYTLFIISALQICHIVHRNPRYSDICIYIMRFCIGGYGGRGALAPPTYLEKLLLLLILFAYKKLHSD